MRGLASGPTGIWMMKLIGDLAFLPIGYPITDPFCYPVNLPPDISFFPPATFYSDTFYVSPTTPGYFLNSRPYLVFTKPQHLHTRFLSSPTGDPSSPHTLAFMMSPAASLFLTRGHFLYQE